MKAYLRVYNDVIEWQINHPDEAAAIYAEETKMPFETVRKIITAEHPNLHFTEESILAQQETINTLVDIGYIKKRFTFEERINNQYLDEIFKSNK